MAIDGNFGVPRPEIPVEKKIDRPWFPKPEPVPIRTERPMDDPERDIEGIRFATSGSDRPRVPPYQGGANPGVSEMDQLIFNGPQFDPKSAPLVAKAISRHCYQLTPKQFDHIVGTHTDQGCEIARLAFENGYQMQSGQASRWVDLNNPTADYALNIAAHRNQYIPSADETEKMFGRNTVQGDYIVAVGVGNGVSLSDEQITELLKRDSFHAMRAVEEAFQAGHELTGDHIGILHDIHINDLSGSPRSGIVRSIISKRASKVLSQDVSEATIVDPTPDQFQDLSILQPKSISQVAAESDRAIAQIIAEPNLDPEVLRAGLETIAVAADTGVVFEKEQAESFQAALEERQARDDSKAREQAQDQPYEQAKQAAIVPDEILPPKTVTQSQPTRPTMWDEPLGDDHHRRATVLGETIRPGYAPVAPSHAPTSFADLQARAHDPSTFTELEARVHAAMQQSRGIEPPDLCTDLTQLPHTFDR